MKAFKHLFALFALSTAATLAWTGCSSEGGDGSAAGDEDDITSTKCKIVNVREGRAMTSTELRKLNDPVARFILGGAKGACPTSLQDSVGKLGATDKKDCVAGGGGGPFGPLPPFIPKGGKDAPQFAIGEKTAEGNVTRLVSERSQALGKPDSYRAVLSRQCNGRQNNELLISVFGLGADDDALPGDFEAIGKDKVSGVFNYYAREEGQWKFFGSSLDLIGDGYDCKDNGACTPKAAAKTRCAGCHVGGGLIMKELNSPWVHWEGDTDTPGADDFVKKHKALLGNKGNGIDMENLVASGNRDYNPKRLELLKTKGVAEVLRPLFCTVDINLQSMTTGTLSRVSDDLFLDRRWSVFESFEVKNDDYQALIGQFKQRIVDGRGTQLKNKDGKPVTDTVFPFTYPERGAIDEGYEQLLIDQKIVDEDFVKDVLHVDFTRPIFSGARCKLLDGAPELAADKMTPDAIRDGFVAKLKGSGDATAKAFVASLQKKDDAAAHEAEIKKFTEACKKRPSKDFLADVMTYASGLRRMARANTANSGQGIIEFSETMVVDDIPASNKAFDPATCTLK
jgi:hypothetical protein